MEQYRTNRTLTFQKAIESHNQQVYFTRRMTHISAKTSKHTSNYDSYIKKSMEPEGKQNKIGPTDLSSAAPMEVSDQITSS
jgi:hypothetical protein